MIVYRIEHSESGLGPYRHDWGRLKPPYDCGYSSPYQPGFSWSERSEAWKDNPDVPHAAWKFAYLNLSALFAWWTPRELNLMSKRGMRLVVLKIDEPPLMDDKQVMYNSLTAVVIDSLPLPRHFESQPRTRKPKPIATSETCVAMIGV